MIFNIIGNIASGKSTLADIIRQKTGHPIYDIDDYRRRYNKKGTELGERLSWQLFIDDVAVLKDGIVTTSGTSKYYPLMVTRMTAPCLTIFVNTDPAKCWKQHEARIKKGYELPPMPFESKSMKNTIYRLHDILMLEDCHIKWQPGQLLPI